MDLPPLSTSPEDAPLHAVHTVIGLLGAIGAGKTYAGRRIAWLCGAQVVDADALAGEVLAACAADGRLEATLGAQALLATDRDDRKKPDREAIARIVFRDPEALRRLERLIHPEVLTGIKARIRRHRSEAGSGILVLDVPLLLETGLDRHCDVLWFVDAPDALRLERAAKRGIGEAEVRRREARQSPVARKRARADFVLHNDRDLEPQIVEGLRALGLAEASPQPEC